MSLRETAEQLAETAEQLPTWRVLRTVRQDLRRRILDQVGNAPDYCTAERANLVCMELAHSLQECNLADVERNLRAVMVHVKWLRTVEATS